MNPALPKKLTKNIMRVLKRIEQEINIKKKGRAG